MSVVELSNVSKAYGDFRAVDDVDLVVRASEFVTLLGPSGCGKTTTLRMIAGFVLPSSGSIVLGGRDVTNIPPHRREVGLVFQNYALFPHMSVAKNVEFGLKMRGIAETERVARVRDALALVQLGDLGDRFPRQLSGGQQQRVALARALVIRPKVLLLDEPFGALDKQLRDHMRTELRALQQKLEISTIFVTHDQDEAMSMSDRICVMAKGKIQQVGVPGEIYERPNSRFVADFMGRSNLIKARIVGCADNGATVIEAGELRLTIRNQSVSGSPELIAMIRPEHITLRPAGTNNESFRAQVRSVMYLGPVVHYEVQFPKGQSVIVTMQNDLSGQNISFEQNQAVDVIIPPNAVYLLNEQ
jgi:putative spermidine/putrescine transport system ATP-binding protein